MSRMSGIILDRILWHLDSLTWSLKEKGRRIREVFRKQDNYIPEYYNRSPPEESRLRILVLGAKGSGKSTFFKQMRILHHGGIPEEERRTYTSDIYRHVLKSVEEVLLVIRELGLEYADEESLVNQISEYSEIDSTTSLSPEIVSEIHRFWRNLMVESVVEQHGSWEEHFEDNGDHFLSQITRIGSPDYIPTEQDILFARTSKATGVLETSFSIEDNSIYLSALPFTITLYSGKDGSTFTKAPLLSSACHWPTTTSLFHSVLTRPRCVCNAFKCSSPHPNVRTAQNQLADSIALWEGIARSSRCQIRWMFLFLNKLDTFRRKLAKIPLEDYFPDYPGGNDVAQAAAYIVDKFKQVDGSRTAMYPHLTELADTRNTRLIFGAVKETILQRGQLCGGLILSSDSWIFSDPSSSSLSGVDVTWF